MRLSCVAIACLWFLLLIGSSQPLAAAEAPAAKPPVFSPDEAAAQGIVILQQLVTERNFKQLGFDTLAEGRTGKLTLGSPLEVFWVGLDQLKMYRPGTDPAGLLFKSKMRTYPVMLGSVVKSSLTVSQSHGNPRWQATRWGSANLIRSIRLHIRLNSEFLVWIPSLNLYFLGDATGGQFMMTPLASHRGLGFQEGQALPTKTVFAILYEEAKAHDGGAW
jgi:hypothetical protein